MLEMDIVLKKGRDIGSTIFAFSLDISREKEDRRNFGRNLGDFVDDSTFDS